MAKLDDYREYIQKVLTEYAQIRTPKNKDNELELQTVFDIKHDHYQLIYVGWDKGKRVFGPVMHLDIKNEKIWLQWNGTEDDIAEELGKLGVPKHDIVIGWLTPSMRKYTDFAVG